MKLLIFPILLLSSAAFGQCTLNGATIHNTYADGGLFTNQTCLTLPIHDQRYHTAMVSARVGGVWQTDTFYTDLNPGAGFFWNFNISPGWTGVQVNQTLIGDSATISCTLSGSLYHTE